jgi:hypothetical protein
MIWPLSANCTQSAQVLAAEGRRERVLACLTVDFLCCRENVEDIGVVVRSARVRRAANASRGEPALSCGRVQAYMVRQKREPAHWPQRRNCDDLFRQLIDGLTHHHRGTALHVGAGIVSYREIPGAGRQIRD